MHLSRLHLRIRIGRLAGALALAAGTLTLASVGLGIAGSTPAGAATGCGMSLGPIQLEGAAGSLVFDAQTIPAVPGQGCNATVSLTGTIETPGGTLPNNVAGNGQAHTLTVSFLPGQPPPDIIWEWSPHCADPGTLPYQFFVSSPTAGTATSPPLNPSGSPSLSCSLVGTIPGSTLNPPEVEFQNPQSFVGMAPTPGNLGYWLVTRSGEASPFGNATGMTASFGNAPVVGAADASATGYWHAAADGGVFALGTAPFFGSMGGHPLNAPVVGIASTPDHGGYWLVATDGGVFSFGDALFQGSMGGRPAQPAGRRHRHDPGREGLLVGRGRRRGLLLRRRTFPWLDGWPPAQQAGRGHGGQRGGRLLARRQRRRGLLLRRDLRGFARQPHPQRSDQRDGRRGRLGLLDGRRRRRGLRLRRRTLPGFGGLSGQRKLPSWYDRPPWSADGARR